MLKIVSLGCLGLLVSAIVLGVIATLASGGDRQQASKGNTPIPQGGRSQPLLSPTPSAAEQPTAAASTATRVLPTPTATPDQRALMAVVDTAWANGDWPQVIRTLQVLRSLAPESVSYRDKLYSAFVFYGQSLAKSGDKQGAAQQFQNARELDPNRPEALAQIRALTPTPTPAPSKENAQYLDPRELSADPNAHIGQNVFVQGKSLTVEQQPTYTWIQLQAQVRGRFVTQSVIVRFEPKQPQILSAECYRFYGIVTGTETAHLKLTGVDIEIPVIKGYAWQPVPVADYGLDCASP